MNLDIYSETITQEDILPAAQVMLLATGMDEND